MSKNSKNVATATKKEDSAFERAERIRYEKLAKAPVYSGKSYPDLNLNGTTHKEILVGF